MSRDRLGRPPQVTWWQPVEGRTVRCPTCRKKGWNVGPALLLESRVHPVPRMKGVEVLATAENTIAFICDRCGDAIEIRVALKPAA